MARKPIARVGQYVIVEGIDNPLKVLEIGRVGDTLAPTARDARTRRPMRNPNGYAYRLQMARVKPKWFYEFEINYVVKYQPAMLDVARHAELVQDLGGYETLRDYLDTVPLTTRNSYTVRELKRLVEYCALLAEGTSQEHSDAEAEIISIMQ